MLSLREWAARWEIPDAALRELAGIPAFDPIEAPRPMTSEAAVSIAVRAEAARAGWHLWRNNRGAMKDKTGRVVRYGLANDSKPLGDKLKSGDLFGWRSRLIKSDDVGKLIAQVVNREVKAVDWKYTGTELEEAQLRWHAMILAAGGDSAIVNSLGSIK